MYYEVYHNIMKLILITLIAIIIIGGFALFMMIYLSEKGNDTEDMKEDEDTSARAPEFNLPDSQINTENFDPPDTPLKREQILGKWESESQDFVGEIYPLEGIALIFNENSYQKITPDKTEEGKYTVYDDRIFLGNQRLFASLKDEKLILIYPEYPKAEIYRRAE